MLRFWKVVVLVVLVGVIAAVTAGLGGAQVGSEEPFVDVTRALPRSTDTNYVCRSGLIPPGAIPSRGDHGYVFVEFRTGKVCTGAFVGNGFIFSEGATSTLSDPRYLYSEAGLMAMAQNLQFASAYNVQHMAAQWFRCSSTKQSCIKYIYFLSQ